MTVRLPVSVRSALSTKYLVQETNFSRLGNSICSSTMIISFSTEYLRKFKCLNDKYSIANQNIKNGKIDGEAPTRMSVYKNVKYLTPKK